MAPEDRIATIALDAAISVHSRLGPGLLESVYEIAFAAELERRKLRVERQVPVPMVVDGVLVACAFRADLVVDGIVIIEIKAVERLVEVHLRQTLTHVKLMNLRLGLLINFGEVRVSHGFKRLANGMPE